MGYNTNYKLQTIPPSETRRVRNRITGIDGYDPFDESCKWYEHEEHVRDVSREIPDVIIRVDGSGEDAGDVWTLYALNGSVVKRRQPKWEPPPPDERWLATVASSQAEQERAVASERERELTELARLRAKYEDK